MIQSTGSVASLLSGVYQDSAASLTKSLQRISTGKRVVDASDDMGSYLKATSYSSKVASYNADIKELQTGKGYADAAKAVGNAVVSSLTKLNDLATQYQATADANVRTGLNAQYAQVLTGMNEAIVNGKYAGAAVYVTTALMTAAGFNVGAGAVADNGNVASNASVASANIIDALNKATNYVTTMSTISDVLSDAIKMRSSIVQSYQGAISSLTDVNEAEEQLNVTSNQVRMQATAAMMSQANAATAAIARLFQ